MATSPSHAALICCCTSVDGQAQMAGRGRVDLPGELRVAALHADDVDERPRHLAEHLLDLLAELRQNRRVVAEDLDFDRRGIPFEISEHVLQQLDELDVHARAPLRPACRGDRK